MSMPLIARLVVREAYGSRNSSSLRIFRDQRTGALDLRLATLTDIPLSLAYMTIHGVPRPPAFAASDAAALDAVKRWCAAVKHEVIEVEASASVQPPSLRDATEQEMRAMLSVPAGYLRVTHDDITAEIGRRNAEAGANKAARTRTRRRLPA